jgi:hypothetical protein
MRVLAATTKTQGQRPGDFFWCIEGELVIPPLKVCNQDWEARDLGTGDTGGCGCGRAFTGLGSGKYTTTAEVRELDTDLVRYTAAIIDGIAKQHGRISFGTPVALQLAAAAEAHAIGTVFRYRIGELYIVR